VYVEWENFPATRDADNNLIKDSWSYLYISDNGLIVDRGCCEKVNNAWVAIDGIPFNPHVKRYTIHWSLSDWNEYLVVYSRLRQGNSGTTGAIILFGLLTRMIAFNVDTGEIGYYGERTLNRGEADKLWRNRINYAYRSMLYGNDGNVAKEYVTNWRDNGDTKEMIKWDITEWPPKFENIWDLPPPTGHPVGTARRWQEQPAYTIFNIGAIGENVSNAAWEGGGGTTPPPVAIDCSVQGYINGFKAITRIVFYYSDNKPLSKTMSYQSGILRYIDTLHGLREIQALNADGRIEPGNWGQGSCIAFNGGDNLLYLVLGPGEVPNPNLMLVSFPLSDNYPNAQKIKNNEISDFWNPITPRITFFNMADMYDAVDPNTHLSNIARKWGLYATYKLASSGISKIAYSYGETTGGDKFKVIEFNHETCELEDKEEYMIFPSSGYGCQGALGYGPIE
jgi:hypothetical protein